MKSLKMSILVAAVMASGMAYAGNPGYWEDGKCKGGSFCNGQPGPVGPQGPTGATGPAGTGATSNSYAGAIAGAAAGAVATGGSSSVGNVSGGSASVGGVGNGLGNFSPKAEATIEKGAVVNTVSPTATGNTGTIQGGTASTGAIDNKSSATAGSVGNVGSFSSVKSLSPESSSNSSVLASGNSSSNSGVVGSGNLTIEAGAVTTVDPNSLTIAEGQAAAAIKVALINNGINPETGTRDRSAEDSAREVAIIEAAARIEAARLAQTVKNTPSVSGPPLVSSNDTCMGSTSGSANAPGIGIGFGTTWTESNCVMLKNSRELWNMGMKAASLALMCNDSKNKEALEMTGFECPQTTKAKKQATAEVQAQAAPMSTVGGGVWYAGNDPIVRARQPK